MDRGRARRAIMLDGPFKAAMGITAYVLIVFVKARELSLGGAITLADVREPAVVILCEPGDSKSCWEARTPGWRWPSRALGDLELFLSFASDAAQPTHGLRGSSGGLW